MGKYASVAGNFVSTNIFGVESDKSYLASESNGFQGSGTIPNSRGQYYLPTAYQRSWRSQSPGAIVQDWRWAGHHIKRDLAGFPVWYLGWGSKFATDADCNNVINKALANSAGSTMDLSETIGGSRESFEMVRDRATQVKDTMSAVKNRDFRGALTSLLGRPASHHEGRNALKKFGGGSANIYLEYLFGWSQLFKDIYDASQLIHQAVVSDGTEPNGIVTGYASDKDAKVHKGWPNYTQTYGSTNHKWHLLSACHAKARWRYDHPSKARTFNQLGILNPISAAWKLTKMSFVADWFLPVGDYLDAFSAGAGLQWQHGYCTRYNQAITSASPFGGPVPRYAQKLTTVPQVEMGSMVRIGIAPIPKLPMFDVPTSVGQAQVAVALAVQTGTSYLK